MKEDEMAGNGEAEAKLAELIRAGQLMSNLCHNYVEFGPGGEWSTRLGSARKEWDKARNEYRAASISAVESKGVESAEAAVPHHCKPPLGNPTREEAMMRVAELTFQLEFERKGHDSARAALQSRIAELEARVIEAERERDRAISGNLDMQGVNDEGLRIFNAQHVEAVTTLRTALSKALEGLREIEAWRTLYAACLSRGEAGCPNRPHTHSYAPELSSDSTQKHYRTVARTLIAELEAAVAARTPEQQHCIIPLDGPSALHSELAEAGELEEHIDRRHGATSPGSGGR